MKKRILIVDDDPNVTDYLSLLLEDNNYETFVAKDVPEGIRLAKENKPDLITLDLEMPGEWGPRFYRHMSQDEELKNIPVIVISGLSGNKYAISKAVAAVTKPFDRDELLETIENSIN